MTKKPPPEPHVGDIWIKHAYVTVGYPRGRVSVTDVFDSGSRGRVVKYEYLVGSQAGKRLDMGVDAFRRRFVHGNSPAPDQPLPLAEHTEAYRGEEEI